MLMAYVECGIEWEVPATGEWRFQVLGGVLLPCTPCATTVVQYQKATEIIPKPTVNYRCIEFQYSCVGVAVQIESLPFDGPQRKGHIAVSVCQTNESLQQQKYKKWNTTRIGVIPSFCLEFTLL
jgi:hypothetical protein